MYLKIYYKNGTLAENLGYYRNMDQAVRDLRYRFYLTVTKIYGYRIELDHPTYSHAALEWNR